jgi:hypothetical protein
MSKESVVQAIETLLRQHKDDQRGIAQQEPYRGDFFRQFAAAYNEGLLNTNNTDRLTADALCDCLTSRAPELLEQDAWRSLYTFWQEWSYAWHHVSQMK